VRAAALGLAIVLSSLAAAAQLAPTAPAPDRPTATPAAQVPAADQQRNALEQELLTVQIEKLRVDMRAAEEQRQRSATELAKVQAELDKLDREAGLWWTTPLAIFVPLLFGVVTLAWQARNQRRSNQAELQLKIGDLVIESPAPHAAHQRWELLKGIYEDRLSKAFVRHFDQTNFEIFPGARQYEKRMALFKALSDKASSRDDVITAFGQVFREETDRDWFKKMLEPEAEVEGRAG